MKRGLIFLPALLLCGSLALFANGAGDLPEPAVSESVGRYIDFIPSFTLAGITTSEPDAEIPSSIRNNKFFRESVRLTNLANQAFDEGDYDASARYSEEAVRNADLSDEYVRLQLKIRETDDAIAAARGRLDYAASVNAAVRYPAEYSRAQTAYGEARSYRAAESWDPAIAAANRVLAALITVEDEPDSPPPSRPSPGPSPLPAQYTVRPWTLSKDCFWNIAGYSWVYADSRKWKTLFEANKAKLPDPDNPDLMHPGMVLTIPSIKGERREGMWDPNKSYSPLP